MGRNMWHRLAPFKRLFQGELGWMFGLRSEEAQNQVHCTHKKQTFEESHKLGIINP